MDVSILWKIPLILVDSACLQVAMTPPTPHVKPNAEERVRYSRDHETHDLLPMPLSWGPPVYKSVGHAVNLLEIFAILAATFPSLIEASTLGWLADSYNLARDGARIYISVVCLVGTLFSVFGSSIRAACYRHMGRLFTFELTIHKEHKLVTSGPYSIVRHPSYLGIFSFYLGSAIVQFGPGSYWDVAGLWKTPLGKLFGGFHIGYRVYVALALFARAAKEDEVLRKEFKGQWVSWSQQTPYRLIPFVY